MHMNHSLEAGQVESQAEASVSLGASGSRITAPSKCPHETQENVAQEEGIEV